MASHGSHSVSRCHLDILRWMHMPFGASSGDSNLKHRMATQWGGHARNPWKGRRLKGPGKPPPGPPPSAGTAAPSCTAGVDDTWNNASQNPSVPKKVTKLTFEIFSSRSRAVCKKDLFVTLPGGASRPQWTLRKSGCPWTPTLPRGGRLRRWSPQTTLRDSMNGWARGWRSARLASVARWERATAE